MSFKYSLWRSTLCSNVLQLLQVVQALVITDQCFFTGCPDYLSRVSLSPEINISIFTLYVLPCTTAGLQFVEFIFRIVSDCMSYVSGRVIVVSVILCV